MGHGVAGRVAVVGAGWAGLAAAVTLAGRGVAVTVFEASRQLGGRARRLMVEGVALDNGQHILLGAYRETLALMAEVGADPRSLLLRTPLELRYVDGFHLRAPRLPYPLNLLAATLGATGLSWSERTGLVVHLARLRANGFRIEPDCTVERWLEATGQSDPLRRFLWGPLCVSALNTPVERASAQVFANVLRDGLTGSRAASDLLLPRVDLGGLFPEQASRFLERRRGRIELGAAVRRIERAEGGFRLEHGSEPFAQVIVATGPQHACPLLEGFAELSATRRVIESLDYEPIHTCYLQYPETASLPASMLGFAGGLVQWAFDRGRLGGPRGLIAAVVSGSGAHEDLTREELGERVRAELEAVLGRTNKPAWIRVIAEKRATFSCRPGIARPGNRTTVPGLVLAGDYTASDYPATLESAVRSGRAAAGLVVREFAPD